MEDPALEVPSPTFTLVQTYESSEKIVHHYDLYRIEDPEDIFPLGWDESLQDGIVLVEWPERLGQYTPTHAIEVEIFSVAGNPDGRTIRITDLRRAG